MLLLLSFSDRIQFVKVTTLFIARKVLACTTLDLSLLFIDSRENTELLILNLLVKREILLAVSFRFLKLCS